MRSRGDLCSYHVVRMASVRNTRKVRGVSKVCENIHWQKKQLGPTPTDTQQRGRSRSNCVFRQVAQRVSVRC